MLPLLLMGTDSSRYVMLFIYLVIPFCTWLYEKISAYFEPNSYTIYQFTDRGSLNHQYIYVLYLLEKHNLVIKTKHIECNSSAYKYNNIIYTSSSGISVGKNEAQLHPKNGAVIDFKYDDLNYKITHHDKNDKDGKVLNKYFKITGDIPKIMKYLDQMQLDKVIDNHRSVNYKYYRYDSTTKKFLPNDINVNKSFDNIFLDDDIKTKIIHNIEYFLNNKPKYDELGTQRKLGYLFYGKPGNGKTSMAIAMAKTYNKNIYKIDLSVNKDSFLNQITCVPQGSIVLFEDIDTFDITHDRTLDKESDTEDDKKKIVQLI